MNNHRKRKSSIKNTIGTLFILGLGMPLGLVSPASEELALNQGGQVIAGDLSYAGAARVDLSILNQIEAPFPYEGSATSEGSYLASVRCQCYCYCHCHCHCACHCWCNC